MPNKQSTRSSHRAAKLRSRRPNAQTRVVQADEIQLAHVIQRAKSDPGSLSARDVLGIQRSLGNRTVLQLIAASDQPPARVAKQVGGSPFLSQPVRRPTPRVQPTLAPTPPVRHSGSSPALIQRLIMTDKQWASKSSRRLKARGALLLEIDGALREYNASQSLPPDQRLDLLDTLLDRINAWQDSKRKEDGKVESSRASHVALLKKQVKEEIRAMMDVKQSARSPQTADAVRAAVQDLYRRGLHTLHQFLSKAPTDKSKGEVEGYWQRFRTEAMRVEHAAAKLDTVNDDEAYNAHVSARVLREAMRAFRTISYRHLGSARQATRKTDLSQIFARLAHLSQNMRANDNEEDIRFVAKIMWDINRYRDLAGADDEAEDKLEALGDDEGVDFELLEEMLSAIDVSTTMLGFQGTGGKGNEGFADFYVGAPESGTDERSGAQQGAAEFFSALTPQSDQGKDLVSGAADMENALAGLESDVIGVLKAWKTYKDPNASKDERLQAKLQLAQTPFSTISNVLKFTGGALTAHRGGESGKLAESSFGFTATGTDVSTDVKMAGDFAALFAGIINTISQAIDLVKYIKSGGGKEAKQQKRTGRKDLEAVGNTIRKYTGTVASLFGNYKAAAKLGYQIAGGGQTAAEGASQVINLGGVVPGLQLASSVMQAIQHAYKLVRIGIRRMALTKKITALTSAGAKGDLKVVEAIEFSHEALVKRSHRIGIDLGHALAGIVAGGFNLSGIGLAPGMVISLSSTAMKFGQIALRKGKQWGRERKAKKRAAKSGESYAEWRHRKRLKAARTGKWQQFKTAIDIKFTFNWDKTSENKESTTREVALEVLRLGDTDVYDALGVTDALAQIPEGDFAKRLKIIIDALKKRD
jgi:hypothetical protein